MTYKELELLVLALAPAEATQLVAAILNKMEGTTTAKNSHMEVREAAVIYGVEDSVKEGGYAMEAQVQLLIEKLNHLPPERLAEVGDFIEFLHQRVLMQQTSKDYGALSENAFAKVWENDDDALYDNV